MTSRRARLGLGLALAATLAAARDARAASCSFVTVSGVAFGTYDVFSAAPTDSAGNISYTCSGGASVTMTLSTGSAATFSPRLLQSGAGSIGYNLYLDAARTAIWGDGSGITGLYGPIMPADGVTIAVPIFGRIPAGQDPAIGAYGDTITVTINF